MLDAESAELVESRVAAHEVNYDLASQRSDPVPVPDIDWWHSNGNKLFLGQGVRRPEIRIHPGLPPPTNAVVALAFGTDVPSIVIWGNRPVCCFSYSVRLPSAVIACGGGSTVIANTGVSTSDGARLNARNGGLIYIGENGLWSDRVTVYTDDMHAICDMNTGKRINPRGGQIVIEDRVWLGYEAMVIRSARIGHDAVVGARSLVTGDLPPNSICGGNPARQLRAGIVWHFQDLPMEKEE